MRSQWTELVFAAAMVWRHLLDDGVPLLLFPEGTRSRTGEMGIQTRCRGTVHQPRCALPACCDRWASEAMPYGQNWPSGGRMPVYVTFGADVGGGRRDRRPVLRPHCQRGAGLIDYATTYRANQA